MTFIPINSAKRHQSKWVVYFREQFKNSASVTETDDQKPSCGIDSFWGALHSVFEMIFEVWLEVCTSVSADHALQVYVGHHFLAELKKKPQLKPVSHVRWEKVHQQQRDLQLWEDFQVLPFNNKGKGPTDEYLTWAIHVAFLMSSISWPRENFRSLLPGLRWKRNWTNDQSHCFNQDHRMWRKSVEYFMLIISCINMLSLFSIGTWHLPKRGPKVMQLQLTWCLISQKVCMT